MAEQEKPIEDKDEAERYPILNAMRRLLHVGVGAVALAQDEVEDLVDKLVQRGEIAESDGKKLIKEFVDRRKAGTSKLSAEFEQQLEELLGRMNIPSKAEIAALSEKIGELTRKVEELKHKE